MMPYGHGGTPALGVVPRQATPKLTCSKAGGGADTCSRRRVRRRSAVARPGQPGRLPLSYNQAETAASLTRHIGYVDEHHAAGANLTQPLLNRTLPPPDHQPAPPSPARAGRKSIRIITRCRGCRAPASLRRAASAATVRLTRLCFRGFDQPPPGFNVDSSSDGA